MDNGSFEKARDGREYFQGNAYITFLRSNICIKMNLNLKMEICVFWMNTNISMTIITDINIQLKICFSIEDMFLTTIYVYQIE